MGYECLADDEPHRWEEEMSLTSRLDEDLLLLAWNYSNPSPSWNIRSGRILGLCIFHWKRGDEAKEEELIIMIPNIYPPEV